MRRCLALFSLLGALAVPWPADAHGGHAHRVLGTVSVADATHLEVHSQEGEDVSIVFSKETKFVRGKKQVSSSDISTGERVAVTYAEEAGRRVAREVHLSDAAVAPPGKEGGQPPR